MEIQDLKSDKIVELMILGTRIPGFQDSVADADKVLPVDG